MGSHAGASDEPASRGVALLRDAIDVLAVEAGAAVSDAVRVQGLRSLWPQVCALYGQVAARVGAIHATSAAQADGFSSTGMLLRRRLRVDASVAARLVRVGAGVTALAATRAALTAGVISVEHADAIIAIAAHLGEVVMADGEMEHILLVYAAAGTPAELRRLGRLIKAHLCGDEDAEERQVRLSEGRRLTTNTTFEGMLHVEGMLDPVTGAAFLAALAAYQPGPDRDHSRTARQRRADALADIVADALANGDRPSTGDEKPHVTVTVSYETLLTRLAEEAHNQAAHAKATRHDSTRDDSARDDRARDDRARDEGAGNDGARDECARDECSHDDGVRGGGACNGADRGGAAHGEAAHGNSVHSGTVEDVVAADDTPDTESTQDGYWLRDTHSGHPATWTGPTSHHPDPDPTTTPARTTVGIPSGAAPHSTEGINAVQGPADPDRPPTSPNSPLWTPDQATPTGAGTTTPTAATTPTTATTPAAVTATRVAKARTFLTNYLRPGGPALLGAVHEPISAETARRLACDAMIIPVVLGSRSEPLDIGRASRTVPLGMRRAVELRDVHCRFPGCSRPAKWCEAHHVRFWIRDQGPTNLANIVLQCKYHHTRVHEYGWTLSFDPITGTVTVTRPDGRPYDLTSHRNDPRP